MHPCDAKGIFFSEVEVLRAHQSKGPSDVEFHVTFDGLCVGFCGGAGVGVGFVSTECLRLFSLFFSIYSNPSFNVHFYQCFFMLPLAAPCRTASKWRFCEHRMLVLLNK